MNIEFSVKEENGVVTVKIISPDKQVVIETETNKRNTVSALSDKITSLNREYERLRKAVYRAKKKLAESVVPNTVPGDTWGQGQAVTSYNSTTNTVTHNHVFDNDSDNVINPTMCDQAMSHKEAETTSTRSPKLIGNCLPFVPEDVHQFIPLANLPEVYQSLLQAWNDLPLPEKLKGLYPDVAQKLHHLLKGFGKAAVQKAIRMVADSPFLLGKVTNTRGWKHICFGWLLKPGNLKKVLENKYRDRSREWKQGNECVTYPEYIPWSTVKNTVNRTTVTANAYTENTVNHSTVTANAYTESPVNHSTVTANAYTESPAAATGYGDPWPEECSADNAVQSCFLDPEYMLKGLDPLTDQARSNLAWAAARLGLTKTPAA